MPKPCPTHGHRYQALGGPLCIHPNCIMKLVYYHVGRSKSIGKMYLEVVRQGAEEDLVPFLFERLMKDVEDRGVHPTIHMRWLWYSLSAFMRELAKAKCHEHLDTVLSEASTPGELIGAYSTPEQFLYARQVLEIGAQLDAVLTLTAIGELNQIDALKLKGVTPKRLKEAQGEYHQRMRSLCQ